MRQARTHAEQRQRDDQRGVACPADAALEGLKWNLAVLHRIHVCSFFMCGMRHVGKPTQLIRRRAQTDGAVALARAHTYARSWPPRCRHTMSARPNSAHTPQDPL